jgi:hypothetical protein
MDIKFKTIIDQFNKNYKKIVKDVRKEIKKEILTPFCKKWDVVITFGKKHAHIYYGKYKPFYMSYFPNEWWVKEKLKNPNWIEEKVNDLMRKYYKEEYFMSEYNTRDKRREFRNALIEIIKKDWPIEKLKDIAYIDNMLNHVIGESVALFGE